MEQSWYDAFHRDTEARLQAHDDEMQEMRAEFAVWRRTQERHQANLEAILDRLAAAWIDHEARLSDHQRAMQEIATTLQAIRDSL